MAKPKKLRPPKPHDRDWGEGTVKEVRPGVWRAWRARVTDPAGKATRPSRTFTGDDAEQLAKLWARGDVQAAVLLLGHWLDRWLSLRQPTIDPGTYLIYRTAVVECGPLALRPIGAVSTEEWQELTNALLKRWSRYHVKVWRTIVSSAIDAAIPSYLDTNPLKRVRLPKPDEQPPKAWRQEEIDRLLGAAVDGKHEAWLVFSLGTGVRLGEARALRWEDVDLANMTATIRASLDNRTSKRGPTKTRRVRIIDIPDEVAQILSAHAKRQRPGTALVFGKDDGTSARANTLRDFLRRTCKAAGVRELSPHSLRHTYASLALDEGVPIQDIAHQLGHSVKTCQSTYAHFIGQGLRRASRAIGKALRHRFSGPERASRAKNGTRSDA